MVDYSPLRAAGPADWRIAKIAARQHGVISHAQLRELGLTENQIRYRLRIGRLHRIERGVYAVGHDHLDAKGRWMAGVLTCGAESLLSHRPAGALWGIAPYNGSLIDITAPRRRRSRGRLRLHRARLHEEDRTVEDGIPVTSVARTLLDLAAMVGERRAERALERAEKLEVFDLLEIEAARARARGHRGLKNLNTALALYVPDRVTRSELEAGLRELCRDRDLPPPLSNATVAGHEVDALWPEARLIVELDGWEHHRDRAAFERDRVRDSELTLAGYRVIRITWRRLRDHPEEVAALIRGCLREPRNPAVPAG
jgi:very-short-patch-repair endonuclease